MNALALLERLHFRMGGTGQGGFSVIKRGQGKAQKGPYEGGGGEGVSGLC